MRKFMTFAAFLLCSVMCANAQQGKLKGMVLSKVSGERLDSAIVLARDGDTRIDSTIVNSDGEYAFYSIPPGSYTISAARKGYQQQEIKSVTVTADKTTYVDIRLTDLAPARKKKVKLRRVE